MINSFKRGIGLLAYGTLIGIAFLIAFGIVAFIIIWTSAVVAVAVEGLPVEFVFGIVVLLIVFQCLYCCCGFCVRKAKHKKKDGDSRRENERAGSQAHDLKEHPE